MLDSSGSIGFDNFKYLVAFVRDFISPLNIETGDNRVGLMVFNEDTNVIFHLNK